MMEFFNWCSKLQTLTFLLRSVCVGGNGGRKLENCHDQTYFLNLAEEMLAATSKNPVTVDARGWSQICVKVNISRGLPSRAEKDTVLHETTHRRLFWDCARLCLQPRVRKVKDYRDFLATPKSFVSRGLFPAVNMFLPAKLH